MLLPTPTLPDWRSDISGLRWSGKDSPEPADGLTLAGGAGISNCLILRQPLKSLLQQDFAGFSPELSLFLGKTVNYFHDNCYQYVQNAPA